PHGAEYYEELPVDYVHEVFDAPGSYFTITLEYGPDHDQFDPFDVSVGRIAQDDAARSDLGRYLHPVVRHYRRGELLSVHHVTENLENEWADPVTHCDPLRAFFHRKKRRDCRVGDEMSPRTLSSRASAAETHNWSVIPPPVGSPEFFRDPHQTYRS